MNMEFNWLVFNGKSAPATTPLIVRLGDRVRIRLINLGMDHHPIHLHGHTFYTTGTEGGRIPEAAWMPGNTALIGVAQSRDVEFVANNPGDWMLHCHMPHHMMNQMSSNVGPMSRGGTGMPAGVSMNQGMGMLNGTPGAPMGDDYGPSLGRGLGVGSTSDQPVSNAPLSTTAAQTAMQNMDHGMPHGGMNMSRYRAQCKQCSRFSAGRLHGRANDGDGRNGGTSRELRATAGVERLHAGHDEFRTRPSPG